MKKSYYAVLIPFLLGVGCFVTYNLIGSYVAEDGTLVESFGFIPISYLMFAIAIVATMFLAIKSGLQKTNKKGAAPL